MGSLPTYKAIFYTFNQTSFKEIRKHEDKDKFLTEKRYGLSNVVFGSSAVDA